MRHLAPSFLAIALVAGIACSDDKNPAAVAVITIEKAPDNNGDMQRDTVLSTLAPLRVLVLRDGAPASGAQVYWTIARDSILETTTTTDATGTASLPLTLGAKAGDFRAEAALGPTVNARRVNFAFTALPGLPVELRRISGEGQSDTSMAQLSIDYVVQILDGHGNPMPDIVVDWAIAAGGGSISQAQSLTTAPFGYARTRHPLGAAAGEQTVMASVPALPGAQPAMFTSIAVVPPPPVADGYLPLAVEMTVNGNTDVYRINANGTDKTRLTTSSAFDGNPVWSNDGTKIAFISHRSGPRELWVMNADGSDQFQLTTIASAPRPGVTTSLASGPVWSPDGTRIAFVSQRDSVRWTNLEIHVVNADGSGQRQLTTDVRADLQPSWSPDGRKIAFVTWRNGRQEIFTMDADGGGQARFVSMATDSWDPVWSPDGRKLSFTTNTGGYYGVPDIYVASADGSSIQRLIQGGQDARWSADGTTIAFTMISRCSYYYYDCIYDAAIVKADGTGAALLTAGRPLRASGWSPNGQWISLTETTCSGGCVDAVRLVRRNGTGFRSLATASNASWKP